MANTNRALKRKRRRTPLLILATAGVSLAMASGTAAAVPTANDMSRELSAAMRSQLTFHEEEIYDASLALFSIFDRENATSIQLNETHQLAAARRNIRSNRNSSSRKRPAAKGDCYGDRCGPRYPKRRGGPDEHKS